MSSDDLLDDLIAAYLERLDGGDGTEFEAQLAARPDLAVPFAQRLRALEEAGFIEGLTAAREGFPERLGEFRLLQRLGEGGMGVVYLAEQPSLGRRVAIKLVRPDQLYFRGARERFRREAEAVARMAHPSIVPVYAVGEEQGIPYFVMEHVPGVGLDELIERFHAGGPPRRGALFAEVEALARRRGWTASGHPEVAPFELSWNDACLWMVREMAQALEHAHQRGVLHRDVKPSNAMLTPDGRIQLMDFGLASSAGAERATRTGIQTGSLPYMAPEQLQGRPEDIDARTDVYALGVTLYELLSLRLPFGATTALELHQEIRSGRPRSLREVAPSVTRDMATVVARAMAVRPQERYRSAADLARDLSNLLERRPIEARPTGAWTQLVRWVQRNPAAAGLLAVVLGVAVGAPLVFGLQQQRLNAREERQRLRAEANLDDAFAAVREMLAKMGEDRLENVPGTEELRLEFLNTAVTFCDALIERNPDDVRVREMRAALGQPLAEILRNLGRSGEAQSTLLQHLGELRHLRELGLMPSDVLLDLAETLNVQGILQLDRLQLDQAQRSFEEAEALQREALALDPTRVTGHADLALIEGNLALVWRSRGDLETCAETYERALADARAGLALTPDDFDMRLSLSGTLTLAALVDVHRQAFELAAQRYEEALGIQTRLVETAPENATLGYEYVRTCVNYGALLARLERCERGRDVLEAGRECARRLHSDYPAHLEYHNAYGTILAALGELLCSCGDLDAGTELLVEACEVLDQLALRPGINAEQRMHASQSRASLGRALLRAQRFDEAGEVLVDALELCEAAWRADPNLASARNYLGMVRMDLALLDLHGGGSSDIAAELEDLRPLVERDPHALADLAGAWIDLAAALGEDGAAARRRAIELLLDARAKGFERTRAWVDSPRWAAVRDDPQLVGALALEP